LKTIEVAMMGINGALYAVIGILTYLGIFAPDVGVVRFWPAVFVPGAFAVLFGPWTGGVGAAIGIFISDMVIHGNAFLSLTVGVPSNFIGFFLVGYIARKNLDKAKMFVGLTAGTAVVALLLYLALGFLISSEVALLFIGVVIGTYLLSIITGYLWPQYRSYNIAAIIGLAVGSAIIGVGVWAFSQVFPVPYSLNWVQNAPFYASWILLVWTFATEIPFLIAIVPPILKACYSAFPSLKLQKKGSS